MNYQSNLSIKMWAEEDRPREKLQRLGVHNLTNAELLAILIKSGTPEKTALDIAQLILADGKDSLYTLGRRQIEELVNFPGIGPAKAITLVAALELGRRIESSTPHDQKVIDSSYMAYKEVGPIIKSLQVEEFWVLFLNRKLKCLACEAMSRGGISATIVDPKVIFKRAIYHNATTIILAHNHPSGSPEPSKQDIRLTKQLVEAGKYLDIPVSDHLIIGGEQFFSFADEGKL